MRRLAFSTNTASSSSEMRLFFGVSHDSSPVPLQFAIEPPWFYDVSNETTNDPTFGPVTFTDATVESFRYGTKNEEEIKSIADGIHERYADYSPGELLNLISVTEKTAPDLQKYCRYLLAKAKRGVRRPMSYQEYLDTQKKAFVRRSSAEAEPRSASVGVPPTKP